MQKFKAMVLLLLFFKNIPIFPKNIKFRLTCNGFTIVILKLIYIFKIPVLISNMVNFNMANIKFFWGGVLWYFFLKSIKGS